MRAPSLLSSNLAASWLLGTAAAWAQGHSMASHAGVAHGAASCPVGARSCPSASGTASKIGRGGALAAQSEGERLAEGGLSLGFDYGTSGARLCAVDAVTREQVDEVVVKWASEAEASSPECWTMALDDMLMGLPASVRSRAVRLCVGGTSSSVLLVDGASGAVTRDVRMYNWNLAASSGSSVADAVRQLMEDLTPPGHTVRAPTSTLSKVLAWALEKPLGANEVIAHQADYVAAHLLSGNDPAAAVLCGGVDGRPGFVTEWHNALKIGFDVGTLQYP